jgi:hypothetical protein
MAITTSGTSITFNDATTQTTAPVNTSANVNSVTLTAGTGVSVTGATTTGAAAATITNTGVTSVNGQTGAATITNISGSAGYATSAGSATSATSATTAGSISSAGGLQNMTVNNIGSLALAGFNQGYTGGAGITRTWNDGISGASISVAYQYSQNSGYCYSNGTYFDVAGISTTTLPGSWRWLGGPAGNQTYVPSNGVSFVGAGLFVRYA